MAHSRPAATSLCHLAHAAREGDRDALARLLGDLQDTLWRYCHSQLASHADAEDAVQETAKRIITSVVNFRSQSTAKTWALGIALNVCRERRRASHQSYDEPFDSLADDTPPPDDFVENREDRQQLHRLLDTLAPRQREATVLRYFEQLSIQETAQVMDCSEGAVKAAVWQSLRNLREKLTTQRAPCE